MVNTACAKGLFRRAASREVKIPADFAGLVDGLMVRRCLDLIGLARRAGKVVAGFEKVQARLRERREALRVALERGDHEEVIRCARRLLGMDDAEEGHRPAPGIEHGSSRP